MDDTDERLLVGEDVDDKLVTKWLSADGAGFEFGEIGVLLLEHAERFMECTGLVISSEDERGFVGAGNFPRFAADGDETGDIVRLVLNIFGEYVHMVNLCGVR